MKISIALCTYNGEKFLRDQLDSIAAQTRLPDELVLCDDRSGDGTFEILEKFRDKAPFPVLVHQNKANQGSTKNFAKAIDLCGGDIIVLSDQDDVWKREKLKRLEQAFLDHPRIGYVFSDGELVNDSLQPIGRSIWESNRFYGETYDRYVKSEQLLCFLRWQIVTGATMAFRARLKKYLCPFPEHKVWIHDGWIAVIASSIGEIGLPLSESLILYRQHNQQQLGGNLTAKPTDLYKDFLALQQNRKEFIQGWADSSAFFASLRKHLMALPVSNRPETQKSIKTLEEFEEHFQNRLKIFTSSTLGKFSLITGELFSGRYGKFSNSWKSAIADLFF